MGADPVGAARPLEKGVNNSHVLLMDATCYECYIRFPTDVKLQWESCHWVFEKQLYRLLYYLIFQEALSSQKGGKSGYQTDNGRNVPIS